ncbi:MAG: hypothetical protein IPK03_16515 [Bacteroidetes bacterium]|nr:hypothetical protein [Bacteroidota bacterium]
MVIQKIDSSTQLVYSEMAWLHIQLALVDNFFIGSTYISDLDSHKKKAITYFEKSHTPNPFYGNKIDTIDLKIVRAFTMIISDSILNIGNREGGVISRTNAFAIRREIDSINVVLSELPKFAPKIEEIFNKYNVNKNLFKKELNKLKEFSRTRKI